MTGVQTCALPICYESYDPLCTIEICYYSESAPTGEGSYWHYGADGVTPVKW